MNLHQATIAELITGLREKKFSSVELTQAYLDRIHLVDTHINAYITVTNDAALAAAKAADKLLAADPANVPALCGIPFAQKDIFLTQGIKTSCGSKMLDNFIAPYDATIVTKLKQAGAVMLGKTNMDEFAMGSSNENSYYGPVKNPWDLMTTPGGSSGGSSAAVAANLAPAATGTDTGGSIRQPAALTGITGLKPSYGRVSRYGMVAFASSLDQAGPMTQTAEDAALFMNAIAGFDPNDSTSVDLPVPDYTKTLNDDLQGLRIGLPKSFFTPDLDEAIATNIRAAIQELEKLGATVCEIQLPHMHLSEPAYYVIAPAECASNLARFDGVRYGYRCKKPQNIKDLYKRSRGEGFGAEVKRRIIIGTFVLSTGYYDAYYLKAQKIRRLIRNDFVDAFKKVDVIIGPTTPSTAFKIGEKVDDPISMYLSDVYTPAVNLAGLPGISIPAGFVNEMPVGMQIIGNDFSEAKILNVAHRYQQVTDWHRRHPDLEAVLTNR